MTYSSSLTDDLRPLIFESPQTRVGGNGRRSMAREPQNTPCSRPLLRPRELRTPSPRADCSSRVRREDVDGLDAAVQRGAARPITAL